MGLAELLEAGGAMTFGVREGALTLRGDEILTDDDVRSGPTHLLATHAIFELSFQPGITAEELERLVLVLAEDRDHRRRRGEDLVTLLWRHHFTHVRYRHLDVLAMAVAADAADGAPRSEDEETRRLREDLAQVVQRLAFDEASGQDLVAMTDRALDTPAACQQAIGGNQQRIAWAAAAFAHRTPPRVLEALALEVHAGSAHEALVVRLAAALIDNLLRHPDPLAEGSGIEVLWTMLDDLLAREALGGVRFLVERGRAIEAQSRGAADRAVSEALLTRLAAPVVVARVIELLDRGPEMREPLAVLRALGDRALPPVLERLETVERAPAREAICALVAEVLAGAPDQVEVVAQAIESGRPEPASQLLRAAPVLPALLLARLAAAGVVHGQPAVRAIGVRMIAGFAGTTPDALVVRALGDTDSNVRAVAARAVAQHRIEAGARTIAAMLQRPGALERDPAELRALFHAHASLSGAAAVEDLGRLLGAAAALTSGHKGTTIEAAAMALAATGSEVATEVLGRGAKSLNPRLRGPCKAALASGPRPSLAPEEAFVREMEGRPARVTWPEALGLEASALRRGARPSLGVPLAVGSGRGSVPPGSGIEGGVPFAPPGLRPSQPPGARPSQPPGPGVGTEPSRSSSSAPPLPEPTPRTYLAPPPPGARRSEPPGPGARPSDPVVGPRSSPPPAAVRRSDPPHDAWAPRPSASPPPPRPTPAPPEPRTSLAPPAAPARPSLASTDRPRASLLPSARPSTTPPPIDDSLLAFLRDEEASP